MNKFKTGDKVRIVSAQMSSYWYVNEIGKIYTLKSFDGYDWDVYEECPGALVPKDLQLVKEEPKQMKATDKITVEITLAELAKIYAVLGKCSGHRRSDLYSLAQKTFDVENKRLEFMNDIEDADVLKYHNYENDFLKLMFPQPPKKSKEQIKIEELQETIDKAARELKELREMGEKK